jgi:hypothetical protein
MSDVYKHALGEMVYLILGQMFNPIGRKLIYGCTFIWPQDIVLQYLWKYIILISNPINQGIISRTHNYLFVFINHGAIFGKHMKDIYII